MEDLSSIASVLLPEKYAASSNKDRSLDNVKFQNVEKLQQNIIGKIKPQNEKDYDMMHDVAMEYGKKSKINDKFTVSQLLSQFDQIHKGSKNEYQFLEELYE